VPRSITAPPSHFIAASLLVLGLSGCAGFFFDPNSSSTSYSGVSFSGHAMAGHQPLIGASVQLYAAGTGGNGSAGTALLSAAVTTDASGAFSVAGGYTCPKASSQLYLIARGGKAGASATVNSAIVFADAIGECDKVATGTQFTVNEAATAAEAYALAQFLAVGGDVGASSTNTTGISNAFATAAGLADVSAGTSPGSGFAANGSSPAPRINAVANLLNACAVATPSAPACAGLFSATAVAGSAAPNNTLDAALNLVRHPAANAGALYTLSTASTAFTPTLGSAPADWALFVNYTGGGMNSPTGLGIDSKGNVWVANYATVASEFANKGAPIFANGVTGGGMSASYGLAVDSNDNAWVTNVPASGLGGAVTVFNSSGQPISGANGFTAGGVYYPFAIAMDTDGSAWIADNGNSHLTHLSSSGASLSGANGFTDASLLLPVSIVVDGSHNPWLGNSTGSTVVKVSGNGTQFTPYTCCNNATALAFDQRGNLWAANYYSDSVSEISGSGTVVSAGAYVGGGIYHPQGLAIDGVGNVWVLNHLSRPQIPLPPLSLSELAGAQTTTPGAPLTPSAGIGGGANLSLAFAIAIDASGNIWVTNTGSKTLTEYVGLAAPVKTPLIGLPAAP